MDEFDSEATMDNLNSRIKKLEEENMLLRSQVRILEENNKHMSSILEKTLKITETLNKMT